jgi:hypothetical protein
VELRSYSNKTWQGQQVDFDVAGSPRCQIRRWRNVWTGLVRSAGLATTFVRMGDEDVVND